MLLRVDGLSVERGGRAVLQALSFTLAAGEVVVVTGRNGAGKSTLLRTVAGLLPAAVGRVVVPAAGEEVRGPETMHYLGYEDALKPSLTVRENLEFWAAMLRVASSPATRGRGTMRSMVEGVALNQTDTPAHPPEPSPPPAAVPLPRVAGEDRSPADALAAFGIARLIDLPAAYLSAGQKRRVALARLLLAPRPIWLLDEPLIALDAGAQETLAAVMAGHVAGGGAILAASHAPLGLPSRSVDLEGAA